MLNHFHSVVTGHNRGTIGRDGHHVDELMVGIILPHVHVGRSIDSTPHDQHVVETQAKSNKEQNYERKMLLP